MARTTSIAAAFAASLAVAACSADVSRENSGLAVGALAGGLIGSGFGSGGGRVAATMVGAVIGGIVGSEIGRSLDERDRRLAWEAEYDALERGPSGRSRVWRSGHNANYGEIVPSRPYRRGKYDCRDYTHTIYIGGRPEVMRGTACRNSDGTWEAV